MAASFQVYIDESGDEGFVFLPNEKGSSRWFVLSALVLRTSNDGAARALMKSTRELLGKPAKAALHFRELKHNQRVPYARAIGQLSARTVSILINKQLIDAPENFPERTLPDVSICNASSA